MVSSNLHHLDVLIYSIPAVQRPFDGHPLRVHAVRKVSVLEQIVRDLGNRQSRCQQDSPETDQPAKP